MASAYVALLSLNYTIEQHERSIFFPEIFHVDFLKETTTLLLQFLETYSQVSGNEILDLERRVLDAATEAGCVIDSHAMDQMLIKSGRSGDNSPQLFPEEDIHELMKEFESIKVKAMEIEMETKIKAQLPTSFTPGGPPRRSPGVENNTMIGFDHHMTAVAERIISEELTLQVLPIVGTGGIGKTTLARHVYDRMRSNQTFDIYLWATVSQSCNVHSILQGLVHDMEINLAHLRGGNMPSIKRSKINPQSNEELGQALYQELIGRPYLIVMDDIWIVELWNTIGKYFPTNGRSRIIITTRLLSVAFRNGFCTPYVLEYLDEDESWNLLKRKVFAQDGCPAELEDTGRRIAAGCRGLPLAIVVIAGQLTKSSDMTKVSWEHVEHTITSILHSENDNQCREILSLSYDSLPVYLKPCFLYIGFSQENSEFRVSKQIRSWVDQGILKPKKDECLEDTAMAYLTDLVERNLILVTKRGSRGKIKSCLVHDLLRDLCLRKAHECQFLSEKVVHSGRTIKGPNKIPLSRFHGRYVYFDLSTTYWENKWNLGADVNLLVFRLRCIQLSASQAMDISTFSVPLDSIFMMQNLHTIFIEDLPVNEPVVLPPQIWEMPLLRHVDIKQVVLPDPPTSKEDDIIGKVPCVLENMQSLQDVLCFKLSEEVVKRIPNLKKLKMTYAENTMKLPCYSLDYLSQLCKLESLSFLAYGMIPTTYISFPQSLKKLTLDGCKLPWEDMTMVGSLPNLEVLRLQNEAFRGKQWSPTEGEFCLLKVLHLRNMYLEHWEADSSHFPKLESLVFHNVWRMREFPLSLGYIETLIFISIDFCRFSLHLSAGRLLDEQIALGNTIQVPITRQPFMLYIRHILYELLHANNDDPNHDPSLMVDKFEYDLRQLQAFLRYTTMREENDGRTKELVKHIRDVVYEILYTISTIIVQAEGGQSFTYSFRRLLFAVKEVEYVSVRTQRILFNATDGWDKELEIYNDPPDLLNWNTDDGAYNSRILHMINQYMNIMDPKKRKWNIGMDRYREPVSCSSTVQHRFCDFALLTTLDRIYEESETYEAVKLEAT